MTVAPLVHYFNMHLKFYQVSISTTILPNFNIQLKFYQILFQFCEVKIHDVVFAYVTHKFYVPFSPCDKFNNFFASDEVTSVDRPFTHRL